MKKLALFLFLSLFSLTVRSQAVPGTYPYPVPLPTNGTTPGGTVKVSAPVNTISYGDNRPAYWDSFMGGGYRVVGTTNERNAIIEGRRKEGMWVKVTADDHVYELDSNLTNWIDLGAATAGVFSGINIYNTDSSLTGNRTLTGAGFNLDFTGLANFGVVAATSQTLSAPTININGGSFTKINNAGPDPFIFPAAPSVAAGTDEIMARNPSTDEVTYSPSYTLSMVGTVPDGYVTLAKMADLAQDQFIGRTTASTGVPQTATITAAARTVLDDASVSAMVDTLGGAASTGTGGLVRRGGTPAFTSDVSIANTFGLIVDGTAVLNIGNVSGYLGVRGVDGGNGVFISGANSGPNQANIVFGSSGTTPQNAKMPSSLQFGWTSGNANDSLDTILVRDAAATVQLGADAASPVDQTIKGPDGSGTDKAGGKLTLMGGQSTGTGAGGSISTRTSLSGSTGSTTNGFSTRAFLSAKPTDLTEASATTFCNIALPDASYVGLRIATTVFASDGTDHQVSHVPITFSAINKAGTITISSITVPTATVAVSAGTLTPVTFTAVQNGNSIDVKVAATSSLTQTILRVKWSVVEMNSNGDATVTAL